MSDDIAPARSFAFTQPCLGEGDWHAELRRRKTPLKPAAIIGEVPFNSATWGRKLNTYSSASTSGTVGSCRDLYEKARPWRDELWLWRGNDVQWLGPVLNVTEEGGTLTLSAQDRSSWLNNRLFLHTMKPRGIDLADIFEGYVNYLLRAELPPWGVFQEGDPPLYADDPGLSISTVPTGVTGDRTIYHYDIKIGYSELVELSRTGVDWTCINDHLWCGGIEVVAPGTTAPVRLPSRMTDEHFSSPPRLRRTGEGQATDVWFRGNSVRGHVGGPDPDDGMLIQRVLDEYSIEDEASGLASARGYLARGKAELTYVEGTNDLAATAPVGIDTLVPGARVLVDISGLALGFVGDMRLTEVTGEVNADGEVVRPTLSPLGSSADARGALG